MSSQPRKFNLTEDWTVVILGFLIIFISIGGLVLQVPAYGWKTSEDLFQKVLTGSNLLLLGSQFVFVLIIAALGALLTNKPLNTYIIVFPVIYVLTVIALI